MMNQFNSLVATVSKLAVTVPIVGLLLATGCAAEGLEEDDIGQDELATMGSGLMLRVLARGNLDGDASIETKWRGDTAEMEAEDGDELDFVVAELTLAPGGNSGWHSHPGHVIATLAQGTVTIYQSHDPCVGEDFSRGQTLLEHAGHTEIARNHGTTNVVVYSTFVVPAGKPFRIDQPAPPGSELCP